MFSKKLFAAIAVLVLLTAGVTYAGAQETGEDLNMNNYKNHDQLLAEVGNTVTEFGGFFLSKDAEGDVLNIYLSDNENDTDKQTNARDAIEEKFGASPDARINIIKGDFTIAQLSNWYSSMRDDVWANSHVTGTDLAEQNNRIEISLDDLDHQNDILAILTKLNIPHGAVQLQERGIAIPQQHLQERAHNNGEAIGAYQIKPANLGECSIGFITQRAGTAGLVTAGHCTEAFPWDGGIENTTFYQPTNANPDHEIGNETRDPAFSAMASCPSDHTCRKSDSAFITFDAGVSYERGHIAKPASLGSVNVDTDSNLKVKYEGGSVYVGKTLHRFGRSSGYRTGSVTNTCATVYLGNDRSLLCQYLMAITSLGGDSGSPYYTPVGSTDNVRLYGIHMGIWDGSKVVSPLGGIYSDLGSSVTWNSLRLTLHLLE